MVFQFKSGVTFLKIDEKNTGKELVLQNRRITIHEVADMLDVSSGSVQDIFKDSLNMGQVAIKLMPCLLSEE
jgi:hypothetical protein